MSYKNSFIVVPLLLIQWFLASSRVRFHKNFVAIFVSVFVDAKFTLVTSRFLLNIYTSVNAISRLSIFEYKHRSSMLHVLVCIYLRYNIIIWKIRKFNKKNILITFECLMSYYQLLSLLLFRKAQSKNTENIYDNRIFNTMCVALFFNNKLILMFRTTYLRKVIHADMSLCIHHRR